MAANKGSLISRSRQRDQFRRPASHLINCAVTGWETGNETDIANRCGQELDLSKAEFE